MSLRVNVAGGTNAGHRRPLASRARGWIHLCKTTGEGVVLAGHFRNCPACYRTRPGQDTRNRP